MIKFLKGNLFEAEVEALVNTVNTVGVMGKGIALQFSRAFPEIMKPYKDACKSGKLEVGNVFTVQVSLLEGPKYVINFPTKKHWKGDSKIEFVQSGLQSLKDEIERLGIKSVAIPPLGCGLGGLRWGDVKQEMESALAELTDVEVLVYEPAGAPAAAKMKTATKKPSMTQGRAALLGLMKRYLVPLMDDSVTLLEIHKLMYFMQEAGQPLRLEYVKGTYGPYAKNLHHVLEKMEGHYIVGYGDGSEEPGKVINAKAEAIDEAESFLNKEQAAHDRFHRVETLIDGFETAYGLELLASVHWVAKHEESPTQSVEEATQRVHDWNQRKRDTFASAHIKVAWDRLAQTNWL